MLKVEELEKELKAENLASIYLLFGEETFLMESNLKKIKKLFGETIAGINYINIDEETIENIAKYYDYLEIQPTGNNEFMITKNDGDYEGINSYADIENINRMIINLGDELGKYYVENESKIKNLTIKRNNSILAHGLESQTKEDFENFLELILYLAHKLDKDMKKFMDQTKLAKFNLKL